MHHPSATHSDSPEELHLHEMRSELARGIAHHLPEEGKHPTAIPGMSLYRRSAPTACSSAAYQPE